MENIQRSEDFGFGFMPEYNIVQKYRDIQVKKESEFKDKSKEFLDEFWKNHRNEFVNELNKFVKNYEILVNRVDLNSGIFSTVYFIDSLILANELNLESFDKKFNKLIEKDKLKDDEFVAVSHILIRTRDEQVYIIPVHDFRYYLNNKEYLEKLKEIWKYSDMYIPRSIWWKSFKTLNKDLFKINI